MNLKSYLRGIGAGLIVASAIFFATIRITGREPEAIDRTTLSEAYENDRTDEETDTGVNVTEEGNQVAENGEITDVPVTDNEKEADPEDSLNAESDDTDTPDAQEENGNTTSPIDAETVNASEEPKPINPLPEGESGYVSGEDSVSITIVRGDSSVSVSRRLFEAGIVESAVEFDKYLCENGYDKSIHVGTYEVPYGLGFEDIAKIIAR